MVAWVATILTMLGIVLMNTAGLTDFTELMWLGHRRDLVIAGGVMMFTGIALYMVERRRVLLVLRSLKVAPVTAPPPPPVTTPVLRLAPPQPDPNFVGRTQEKAQAIAALLQGQPANIWGMAGIGKTTLAAVVVADDRLRDRFSDGILWLPVGSNSLEVICEAVARALELAAIVALPSAEERATALRTALAARQLLVVLDNADEPPAAQAFASQISPHTLVTSRRYVAGLAAILLDVLSLQEAVELLKRKLPQPRTLSTEEEALLPQIAAAVNYHPLALALAAAQLGFRPAAELLEGLRRAVLDNLVDPSQPDWSVRASFETSYGPLDDADKALFAALGVFGADFDLAAVQAVVPKATPQQVAALAARSLVAFDRGRYRLHPLLRQYTQEKLGPDSEAYRRMAAYFLAYALAHQGRTPEDYDALEGELGNIFAAMDWAFRQSEEERDQEAARMAVAFMDAMDNILEVRGYWRELVARGRRALAAAEALGDEAAMARLAHNLGVNLQNQGRYAEAEGLYRRSLEIEEKLGNQAGIAISLHQLGVLAQAQGRYEEAEGLYRRSLEIKEKLGGQAEMAAVLHNLGALAQAQGRYEEAEGLYRQSLEIAERLGDQVGIASTLHQLGMLAQLQGRYPEAEGLYQRAINTFEKLGSQAEMAAVLHQLGMLAQAQERYPEADGLYRRSLEIAERLGNQAGIASTLHQLGVLAEIAGNSEEAERLFRQTLEILERLGSPDAETARRSLERVYGRIAIPPDSPALDRNIFQQEHIPAGWRL